MRDPVVKFVIENGRRKLLYDNGVAWNPLAQPSGVVGLEVALSVLDVVTRIRAEVPNANLLNADHFIGVGEWAMAIESIEEAGRQKIVELSPATLLCLELAKGLVERDE